MGKHDTCSSDRRWQRDSITVGGFIVAALLTAVIAGCGAKPDSQSIAAAPTPVPASAPAVYNPANPGQQPETMSQAMSDTRVPASVKAMMKQHMNKGQ